MKLQIIQTLSNGQVTQQVITPEGAQAVKVQTLPNSKTSFNFEPATGNDSGNVSGAEKVKTTRTKQVGNNLILESEGKDLVEMVDFYSVPGASVGDVSWNYASADIAASAVAPEAQALAVIETGNLVAGIPLGLAVASGVVVIGAANAGGGGSTNSATTNNTPTTPVGNTTTNPSTPSVADSTPPTLVITDNVSAVTGTGPVQYTFTFSEAVTGFDATKVVVTGGIAGTFTKINDSTYTLMVTPTANTAGNIVVTASATGVSDLAHNAMVQSTGLSATQAYDTSPPGDVVAGTPPSLVISDNVSALTATGPVQYTFTFSKGVRGFDANHVTITGGTAGTFTKVSDSTYTLGVTPAANSANSIVVTAATAGVTDLASTPMVQTTGLSATQAYDTRAIPTDTAAPTFLIADNIAVATATGPVQYTFSFNEAVSGFDISKLNITGGTAGGLNAVSDQSYTLVVTPTANAIGNISVTLLTNNLSDLSNNPMVQTTGLSSTQAYNTTASVPDTRAPTLTITDNLAAATVKGPIQYTFTFSEAVSDFDVSKITVAGGSLGQLTALSSTVYQLVVTPANNATGNISVSVAANTVHDLANNALATTTSATVHAFDTTSTLWSVSPLSANVNEDAGNISYVITRSGNGAAATIDFSTGGGSAMAGSDYTAVSQNVSFATGELSKTIQVPLTNDTAPEANETVLASIRNASVGSISTGIATVTILDNDQSLWSVVANPTSVDESAGFITYTVSRTGASNLATIDFATIAGTATAGSDYTAVNQTLSFAVGETSKAVLVAINDDTTVEGNETVTAVITNASQGDINTASATATVLDNEVTVWSVSSANTAVSEAAGDVLFTVSRTGPLTLGTINFAAKGVLNGQALPAVEGTDFTSTALTLSFAEGEASKTVRVPLVNDNVPEVLKAMAGQIGNASVGVLGTSSTVVNIQDDDQSIWQVVNVGSVVESAGAVAFTVVRFGASTNATVDLVLSGTATNGSDYTAPASQTLTFAAGEMTKTVLVNLTNDTTPELNETILASLTNVSQGTVNDVARGVTILDDDSMVWAVSATGAVEGGKLVYVVTRSGDSSTAASIDFATSGGTAATGIDFTSVSQTLSFAAGETRKTVLVATINDTFLENNETVIGTLTAATAGTITTGAATATISDDDQSLWSVAATAAVVQENNGYAFFTISRTGSLGAATIDFNTLGAPGVAIHNIAIPGLDYVPLSQTLSFAEGETTKTVQITILDDNLLEQRESFLGSISNPSSGSVTANTAFTFIEDNDATALFGISVDASTVEGGMLLIRVYRFVSDQAATVDLISTGTGTATPGVDYVFAPQTLSFAPGEIYKLISVSTVNDTLAEPSETITFGLVNPSVGALIDPSTTTVTIVDNDGLVSWSIAAASGTVDEGAGYATFTVSRDTATAAATIDVATLGGTAWGGAGNDYGALRQNLSFAIGEFSKTVRVAINEDSLLEGNETMVVGLSNASAGHIATSSTTLTIADNDLNIWSVAASTGSTFEAAGAAMTFIVSRTGDLSAASINVATLANFLSIAGVDYTAIRQTLNFGVGESSKLVAVPILDDAKPQAGEGIFLAISNPSTGRIATATASHNLTSSDETRTTFAVSGATSVDDVSAAMFTFARAGDLSGTDTISYSVSGAGGATAGTDFVATNGVATFLPGVRSVFIGVPLIADTVVDTGKSLVMTLQNASSGTITTATATASLTDNDAPASGANTYAVAATSNNVYESAGTAAFTITRSGDLTIANTSYFRANSGTASNVTDFTAVTSTTLNWAVGETTKVVSVVLQNDALAEGSKTIIGESATNAGFTTSLTNGTLTLLDDDTPGSGTNTYTIALTSPSTIESNGTLAFTITRGGDMTIGSTSYFRANSGTAATDGSDYTVVNSQTLTWVASETTKVVFVTLTNDTISEANETVIGQSASDAAFTPGATTVSVTATVLDDDLWTATAGVADTLTYGTASGGYTGAINVDTGDLSDTVSITSNVGFSGFGSIVLGSGNDLLNVNSPTNFLNVVSADGGSGVDTLAYSGTTAFNHYTQTVDSNVIGFEILDLATAATNQTVGLSLADVLEITRGNAVADTLRIMGNAVSGDVLNLQAAGKTLATPVAGSTIKDVDGTNYTVSASAAGNALTNDVTIGGKTYDVYQYAFDSHTINLLVHTTITTNVI